MNVNSAKALKLLGDNHTLYAKLISVFQEESGERIQAIRQSIEQDEFHSIVEVSHAFKNSALFIGADDLAQQLEAIEKLGKQNQHIPVQNLRALESELIDVNQALNEYLNQNH